MSNFIFTSESVTEGHPDKVCDMISDAILDACMEQDPMSRVACETTACTGFVLICGEITTKAKVDYEKIARDTIREIGYTDPSMEFDDETSTVLVRLDEQSADIAMGVDKALEARENKMTEEQIEATGAGDQGMMFGYASNETESYMPYPIYLAHKLSKKLAEVRKNGTLPYLRPDGKTQVSVIYESGVPVGIDTVLISTQHDPDISQKKIRNDVIKYVIEPVLQSNRNNKSYRILVNPTGRFVIGGPVGDSGLTGRKIIVDTYGGAAAHGGGAFSGKDPTKVDRSGAYAARYLAKNIVAAGLAEKAEVQIAYAIGVAYPVSVLVNTFNTGVISDEALTELVTRLVDLRPSKIIERFDLQRPIYAQTASYGHFGRDDLDLPWERTDLASVIKKFAKGVA